jgi:O-antigen ligase
VIARNTSSVHTFEKLLDQIAYTSLWVFICVVPFEEQVPPEMPHGIALSRWFGLVAAGITVLRVLVTRISRRPSVMHYWMLAFVLWAGMSIGWSIAPEDTIIRVGTYLQLLTMVWLIWELASTEYRCIGLFYAYVLGTCVPSISTIYNFLIGRTATQLRTLTGADNWDEQRFTAKHVNANDLGLLLVLSIPITVYLLSRRKSSALGYLCWLQLGMSITAILLTGSRASLISLAVALTIIPLSLSKLSKARKAVLLIASPAMLAFTIYLIPKAIWERLLSIGTELTQGTLTHRTSIWAAGVDVFRHHPLFGVGAGAFGTSVRSLLDIPYVSHNLFLSVLVELGVIGAVIFFVFLVTTFYTTIHLPHLEKRLWAVLLLSWTVGVSALTWEYRKPTWILFGLLAAHAAAICNSTRQRRAGTIQMDEDRLVLTGATVRPRYRPDFE